MTISKLPIKSPRGMGMLLVMVLVLLSMTLTGAMFMSIVSTSRQSSVTRSYEEAYGIALAAINTVLFKMEAAMGGATPPGSLKKLEGYLTEELGVNHLTTKTSTGTINGVNYTVLLTDPTEGDEMFQLEAEIPVEGGTRRVIAIVRGPEIEALKYALFGNYIHFDNHAQIDWGLNLVTTVFSNSGILIDRGVKISGLVQAVQYISPNTGPASAINSVPNTKLTVTGEQGDPNPSPVVNQAPVKQVIPAPPVKEFPVFEFYEVKTLAEAAGRAMDEEEWTVLLDNARAFAASQPASDTTVYDLPAGHAACLAGDCYPGTLLPADIPIKVMHRNSSNHRIIRVPNGDNPDYTVELGTTKPTCGDYPCGAGTGADETYEIILAHTGFGSASTQLAGNDSFLYVEGNSKIDQPFDTLVRIEGSIIVNGFLDIKSGVEILAWEDRQAPWFNAINETLYDSFAVNPGEEDDPVNFDILNSKYPAIVSNGRLRVVGAYGPVHIEGVVYTTGESHLHRSEPHAPAYAVGSEIADTIHNCEFFSFAYDSAALQTFGLYERLSARPSLKIVNLQDQ